MTKEIEIERNKCVGEGENKREKRLREKLRERE